MERFCLSLLTPHYYPVQNLAHMSISSHQQKLSPFEARIGYSLLDSEPPVQGLSKGICTWMNKQFLPQTTYMQQSSCSWENLWDVSCTNQCNMSPFVEGRSWHGPQWSPTPAVHTLVYSPPFHSGLTCCEWGEHSIRMKRTYHSQVVRRLQSSSQHGSEVLKLTALEELNPFNNHRASLKADPAPAEPYDSSFVRGPS